MIGLSPRKMDIMPHSSNVVVLCGSLRSGSYHATIARSLQELAPEGMLVTVLGGLDELPHYNADIQAEGFPAKALALGEAIRGASGVLFVTPEYNYSIPGFLKNALDWVSRLSPPPFRGKPVAIQTASAGVLGGIRAQYHLRQVLVFLDALPLNKPEVVIGSAGSKISDGRLVDPATRDFIAGQLVAFAQFIDRHGQA
ncbi:chromate reductase [Hyphomicrobiales bacterium]|nr:chromate reductase [Hyphomicrobiales bacterium]CAH1674894.1 chromate reductase [Hyphomicrobiales bacterium]